MTVWNAEFYEWNNPAFGTYDVIVYFSESELPRLIDLYGEEAANGSAGVRIRWRI